MRKTEQSAPSQPAPSFARLTGSPRERAAYIEQLAVAIVGDDNREQNLAVIELLTHLMQEDDAQNLAGVARTAVIRASVELIYEVARLLAAKAQDERKAKGGKVGSNA